VFEISRTYQPKLVWSCETDYRYGGAGQSPIQRFVEFEAADVNGDGTPEIRTRATTTEEHLFVWQGGGFVPATDFTLDCTVEKKLPLHGR
jgi:hypothetical protein